VDLRCGGPPFEARFDNLHRITAFDNRTQGSVVKALRWFDQPVRDLDVGRH